MIRHALLGLALLVLGVSSPSGSNAHEIKSCKCEEGCYTKAVRDLNCSDNKVNFTSNGLPALTSPTMSGITETSQRFPVAQESYFSLPLVPKTNFPPKAIGSGPIGVAVNGIPILSLDPQSKQHREPSEGSTRAFKKVLDECGGHAGDDNNYHYHVAPKCLIEELGEKWVDVDKKPIGYALDGYPIHALGWFNEANDVEAQLDPCRGFHDLNGNYFYNVRNGPGLELVNCFRGEPQGVLNYQRQLRFDKNGNVIDGSPISFSIGKYSRAFYGNEVCHVLSGSMPGGQSILWDDGKVFPFKFPKKGSLFYCNSLCYGLFFNAQQKRALYYDYVTSGCPAGFDADKSKMNLFVRIKQ